MAIHDERLTRLFEKHNRAIRAYCLRRIGDEGAFDAVADVFLVASRRVDDIPGDEMELPWLYGVARRVVADHYRSQNRRARLVSKLSRIRPDAPIQPDSQVVQRAEYRQVHQALAALREKDREVLLLASWEELPHDQIAVVLGCSTEAAAQRIHRAKQKLGSRFRALSDSGLPPNVADRSERA